MTESAYREIQFPTDVKVTRGEEHYEGFGAIPTYTYLVDGACAPKPEAVERLYEDRGQAFRTGMRMLAKGYFGQVPILFGMRPPKSFNDLDALPVRSLGRAALALRAVVLAPLLLPVGAGIQAYRALTRSTLSSRRGQA
jgi:hypothetical protein